jgi:hypothetical protein
MKKDKKPTVEALPVFSIGSKMRIKNFTPEGLLVQDRLVEQVTELRAGPKEKHTGPICLEFNLLTQADVQGMIEYISKLKGDLPIEEKVKKIKKPKDEMLGDKHPIEDLVNEAKVKAKTQEELMTLLREKWDFRFIDSSYIQEFVPEEQIKLRSKDLDYQFMVRMYKEAKAPANDKYDWRLVFGIKIVGDKIDKVQVYLYGKYECTWTKPWDKPKDHNFKKVNAIYIFPEFMTYEERKKWRTENRKKQKDPNFKTSKQFDRWTPYVKVHGEA